MHIIIYMLIGGETILLCYFLAFLQYITPPHIHTYMHEVGEAFFFSLSPPCKMYVCGT